MNGPGRVANAVPGLGQRRPILAEAGGTCRAALAFGPGRRWTQTSAKIEVLDQEMPVLEAADLDVYQAMPLAGQTAADEGVELAHPGPGDLCARELQ